MSEIVTKSSKVIGPLFPHIRQLVNDPKTRRLQFMKTRYFKPMCTCGTLAHYQDAISKRRWCKECLPADRRKRLSLEWQMSQVIVPLAAYLDRA